MSTSDIPRLGVDIGGTFTDVALEVGDKHFSSKVLTTTDAPERGVMDALQIIIVEAGIQPADVGLIIHGTTLATNALIERKGARTALVTTEGFRDCLEMRSESRYEQYDLSIDMPAPLVPRRRRFTVPERIDARGNVRIALDEGAVHALIPILKASAAEAVAIGLLHAYANPSHERRIADILGAALPDVCFSLSHEVSPELREYERISTTCANAYVQPRMAGYLANLERMLRALGYRCPLLMMLSGGGVATIETSIRFPVRLVESGPAGGAIFSSHIAAECALDKVLSFDMGGTTAKICLIDDGAPQTAHAFEVARIYRFKKGSGLPLRIPVIEMVEIGAGGGSIATVDAMQRITVGPRSAGSLPGPACYDQHGQHATVTDADLVLGRLDADNFAGGSIRLNVNAALAAVQRDVGAALSLDQDLAAFGIAEMVDENMSNAARVHSIESGKESGDYTLIAFGGAAPLHCARVAEKLGIKRFIVPVAAGVGSAVGFLRAPVAYEIVRSNYQQLSKFDADSVNAVLAQMSQEASAVVAQAAQDAPLIEKRAVFMRYRGQGHEIAVALPVRAFNDKDAALLAELFERAYANLYSRAVPGVDIETLTWTVSVSSKAPPRSVQSQDPVPYQPKPVGMRAIYDAATAGPVEAPVFERAQLRPGALVCGPAVIVERETTTLLSAIFDAIIDARGNIDCRRRAT